MLVQRQETEQELNQRIQKLSTEKSSLVERVASLQRTLANMETEKREIERQVSRQEKDKSALKKTLDKVNILNIFLVMFTPIGDALRLGVCEASKKKFIVQIVFFLFIFFRFLSVSHLICKFMFVSRKIYIHRKISFTCTCTFTVSQ